ncbi:OmpH family outer membrane protein [Sphingomonas glacialis]|uniref:OmpH family outer membrane protein n=1 Tax=Sphingomonas glacialis TaxID=658225 RepID=A0A502FXT3_9SPHN|nr:OmpH family outer membrane protein [Sphingomonas glacialis]TPG54150.1 OmpH family outer membrane protein [Sphingomonas glacialis]
MKTYQKLMLGCAAILPALAMANSAQAQANGVAISDPETVILTAKALDAANQSISTTYKAQLDQASARQAALQTEMATLGAPLDTNKDKRLSDEEIAAAQTARSPILAKMEAAQKAAQAESARLSAPATRAQAYAIEQISQKYSAAVKTVVDAKKISLLLSANSVQYSAPAVDMTDEIKAALDAASPTVSITPPANWQPSQQTVQLQQQFQQLVYLSAVRRAQAQQAGGAPTGAAPAAGTKAPSGR